MIASILATTAPPADAGIISHYVPFQFVGLGVVIFALGVLYSVCALVGACFRRQAVAPPVSVPVPVPPSPVAEAAEAVEPKVVAAIAAAITVVLDQPYRIVDIQAAGHSVGMTSAWAIEGRFQHFSSHKVR